MDFLALPLKRPRNKHSPEQQTWAGLWSWNFRRNQDSWKHDWFYVWAKTSTGWTWTADTKYLRSYQKLVWYIKRAQKPNWKESYWPKIGQYELQKRRSNCYWLKTYQICWNHEFMIRSFLKRVIFREGKKIFS